MSSSQIELAQMALAAGDSERARSILIPLIQSNPRHGEAWYFLGQAMDDASRRKECFERAAALDYVPVTQSAPPQPAAPDMSTFNLPWEAASAPQPPVAASEVNLPWEAAPAQPSFSSREALPMQAAAPVWGSAAPGYTPVTGGGTKKRSSLKLLPSIMIVLGTLLLVVSGLWLFQQSLASKSTASASAAVADAVTPRPTRRPTTTPVQLDPIEPANLTESLSSIRLGRGLVQFSSPQSWTNFRSRDSDSTIILSHGTQDAHAQVFVVLRLRDQTPDMATFLQNVIQDRYASSFDDSMLAEGMFSDIPSQNVVYTDRVPMMAVLTTRVVDRYVAVIGIQVPVEDFEAHTPRVLELINSVTIDPTVDSVLTKK